MMASQGCKCRQPPATVQEFKDLVASHASGECADSLVEPARVLKAAKAYEDHECTHSSYALERHRRRNRYGYIADTVGLNSYGHSTFALSNQARNHLEPRYSYSNPTVISATQSFKRLLQDRSPDGLLAQLGSPDLRVMHPASIALLLDLLAKMSFPGQMDLRFDFLSEVLGAQSNNILGHCFIDPPAPAAQLSVQGQVAGACIYLHPTMYSRYTAAVPQKYEGVLNCVALARLGTMLHELCHVYVRGFACNRCTNNTSEIYDFRGHGPAWQRVACWVEFAILNCLELPVDLGRFAAVQLQWAHRLSWPSLQEVESWELRDRPGVQSKKSTWKG